MLLQMSVQLSDDLLVKLFILRLQHTRTLVIIILRVYTLPDCGLNILCWKWKEKALNKKREWGSMTWS